MEAKKKNFDGEKLKNSKRRIAGIEKMSFLKEEKKFKTRKRRKICVDINQPNSYLDRRKIHKNVEKLLFLIS